MSNRNSAQLTKSAGALLRVPRYQASTNNHSVLVTKADLKPPSMSSRSRADQWLKKLLRNKTAATAFETLCKKGCSPHELGDLICGIAVLAPVLPRRWPEPTGLEDLSCKLEALARCIELANKTRWLDRLDFGADDANRRKAAFVKAAHEGLPGMMRSYAALFRKYRKAKKDFGNPQPLRFLVLQLLDYVRRSTNKGPGYQQVSDLLVASFLALGGSETAIPSIFSDLESLKKLYQRNKKYCLARMASSS